jgi:hypothetical protein
MKEGRKEDEGRNRCQDLQRFSLDCDWEAEA